MALGIKNIVMGVLAIFSESFFDLVAVAIVADLFGLTSIRAIIIAVDTALGVGLLRDAVAWAGNVAFADFNDSLPGGICQRVVADRLCRPAKGAVPSGASQSCRQGRGGGRSGLHRGPAGRRCTPRAVHHTVHLHPG